VRFWIRRATVAIAAAFLLSQLIPVNRGNPKVDPSQTLYATEKVPPAVKATFDRSCQNCHSNQTAWPWYSYIAPASWVIAHDVHQARKTMNLSEWGSYTTKKREEKLEDICDQVTNGDMPDPKYALFHRSSKIGPDERAAVCQWTEDSR
jgi:Haem-binding domain